MGGRLLMNPSDSSLAQVRTSSSAARTALIAVVVLLDALILVDLAGSVLAAAVFIVFVAGFLLPAGVLALRIPHIRAMPADLRITAASALVVMLVVPWFFLRKALPFLPAVTDIAGCLILIGAAAKFGEVRTTFDELGPALRRSRFVVLIVLPLLFALVWLGYAASSGRDVLFHGLFAIDFGNLVSVVALLRASPMLPLDSIAGGGPMNYHWLYFTLPATLADFCGASIPASNALILGNLLMAALLIHTVTEAVSSLNTTLHRRAVQLAVVVTLFAPFSLYYYQLLAARLPLGPLAMPERNHLILAPVNSMIVFGNNTFALVLVLLTAMFVERWNRERRVLDVILGTIALSMVTGYSVTLLLPLVAALLLWLAMGRIARPVTVLIAAIAIGGASIAMFVAIHVLGSGGARHAAVLFDRGQFLRIVILGMLPLWGLLLLGGRQPLRFLHVLIVTSIVVPSFLYVAGSPTGQIDFSMKTGSMLAIAFAPLIVVTFDRWMSGSMRGWQTIVAMLLMVLGAMQTSAYVLQFPFYRLTGSRSRGETLARDYYDALLWLRDNTPKDSIVADPGGLTMRDVLPTLWIAERRVWLPTPNTEQFVVPAPGSSMAGRVALWSAFMRDPANPIAAGSIAREADYLLVDREIKSPFWDPVTRSGSWIIYHSRAH
ncbi:MAG: hypothetical protein QOK37_2036 [Thermoanaerobaculia bacterium]|jgi:hypothetical protein|nr:hypothetical protein [Thermoanaerobaculia bacterium]